MEKFDKLKSIIMKLRSPDGCPWDKKQTHDTLVAYLFEETNEVADTIFRKDYNHLREELGDLLLHILLHSIIAEENNEFTIENVIEDISSKLIRRHPHVFSDAHAENPDDVNRIWEAVKSEEKLKKGESHEFLLDKIPKSFEPLLKAYKIQKEVGKVGFDWENPDDIIKKIDEEYTELKEALKSDNNSEIEHELGDLLFSIINLGLHHKIHADVALAKCNNRFYERFALVELQVNKSEKNIADFTLNELDVFWDNAKQLLKTNDFNKAKQIILQDKL